MLLVEESSATRLFRHLSDYVFGVRNLENKKYMRVISFPKSLKFNLDFRKALAVVSEFDRGSALQISTLLGHVYHVACRRII